VAAARMNTGTRVVERIEEPPGQRVSEKPAR
jgi:hypothetical protein